MAQKPLGKIDSVDLRSIFPNETFNLTPWLAEAENIALLSDAIGIELTVVDREVQVGAFSADLLAASPDAVDNAPDVVIENQFGATNHDHLGKSITYSAGLGVKKIVWVAERFRSEHRSALAWLNENSKPDVDFFGVLIRAIKIGNSPPAVEFRVAIEPDGWRRRSQSAASDPRGEKYRKFWESLIPDLREAGHLSGQKDARARQSMTIPTGVPGTIYGFTFRHLNKVGLDIYFNSDPARNMALFKKMEEHKIPIEEEFGEQLVWEPLPEAKTCRIKVDIDGSITDPEEDLARIRSWMIDRIGKLKPAVQERLKAAAANMQEGRSADE